MDELEVKDEMQAQIDKLEEELEEANEKLTKWDLYEDDLLEALQTANGQLKDIAGINQDEIDAPDRPVGL